MQYTVKDGRRVSGGGSSQPEMRQWAPKTVFFLQTALKRTPAQINIENCRNRHEFHDKTPLRHPKTSLAPLQIAKKGENGRPTMANSAVDRPPEPEAIGKQRRTSCSDCHVVAGIDLRASLKAASAGGGRAGLQPLPLGHCRTSSAIAQLL